MKRLLSLFIVALLVTIHLNAKTTYIPKYYTQINIECNGTLLADSAITRELNILASDGRYSITVMHDSVTQERVKTIKRMKSAAGLATAATILSGVSASLNPMRTSWDAVSYMTDMNLMASSTMLSIGANHKANNLQKVDVTILIENFSDKEMVVNDMKRGLTWFIPAHNYISLSVGNPEVNKLRIAYTEGPELQKDYITIQAGNYLTKETIDYEDDIRWIYPVYTQKTAPGSDEPYGFPTLSHYEVLNKTSFVRGTMSIEEFKKFKKEMKK